MRYLFSSLIDEEIKRDEGYRAQLQSSQKPTGISRPNIPSLGELPKNEFTSWVQDHEDEESAITPRPVNGLHPTTPGLTIGVATPGATAALNPNTAVSPTTAAGADGNELKKTTTNNRTSGDYFSSNATTLPAPAVNGNKPTEESSEGGKEETPTSPTEPEKDGKSGGLFGKKFLGMKIHKKLGRTSVEAKPVIAEDKSAEESDKSSEKEDKVVEDNFYGIIQKIRNDYDETLLAHPDQQLISGVSPSLPNETPVLKPPPFTTIIIQEDSQDAGGVKDLYRGSVSCVGQDADLIEKAAPMWLGDLLLRVCYIPTHPSHYFPPTLKC